MEQDYEQEFTRKEAQRKRRVLDAAWDRIKDIGCEIHCKWASEPENGCAAVFETVIDGQPEQLVVEPEVRFGERSDKRPISQYRTVAEQWALWKWHTARGTPVSEHDTYQTEPGFKRPVFVWEPEQQVQTIGIVPDRPPRGPGRPPKLAA